MTLTIEIPDQFEVPLKQQANARGVSADDYILALLEHDLAVSPESSKAGLPFKTGRGLLAKYGPAPSAEEIDANRAEMFSRFGEEF